MHKIRMKTNRSIFSIVMLFGVLAVSAVLFLPYHQEGLTLFLLLVAMAIFGMIGGLLPALGVTLLLFFSIGSILFWSAWTETPIFFRELPLVYVLIWMIALIIVSVLSGRFSHLQKDIINEKEDLRNQVHTLVAVDPMTGLDNQERMLLELQLEFSRSKRYDRTFSLLMVRINHLDEFQKLYGSVEWERVLRHISDGLYRTTRTSDQKFRVQKDTFALLLPDTAVERMPVVMEKIKKELRIFQLQNKRYITHSLNFGYAGFDGEMNDYLEIYDACKEQVLSNVS